MDKLGFGILLYGYAIFLGATYLFAFWRPLGFSIFPYLTIQDYLNYPLNRLIVIILTAPILMLPFLANVPRLTPGATNAIALGIVFIYHVEAITALVLAGREVYLHDLTFGNEKAVLAMVTIFFLIAVALTWRITAQSLPPWPWLLLPIALLQTSAILSAGYADGKVLYAGAAHVYHLDNKELCEKDSSGTWLLAGRFSETTVFIDTTNKRLCFTGEKSYRLIYPK